jgi:hypothetical protein
MDEFKNDLTNLQSRLETYENALLGGNADAHVKKSIEFYREETRRVRAKVLGLSAPEPIKPDSNEVL